MSRITIIDNPRVTLWYHSDKKIVHHEVRLFIDGKERRELLQAGSELIKEHHARKWLSDNRGLTVVAQEETPNDWIWTSFALPTIKAGLKYWATVRPQKALGQMGMDRIAKDAAAHGLTVGSFSDPAEAMSWLEKQ